MENLAVNGKGHLTFNKIDTVLLARDFGTPLYVMDELTMRKECRDFKESIAKYYGGHGITAYASKAFCCVQMCRLIAEEGLGLDVSSIGEIHTALRAGCNPRKIYFHGNFKTDEEFAYALDNKVGRIEVDNLDELERLNVVACEKNVTADIMLRVKPGVDAHTHSFIKTGKNDSKFGFIIENGEALETVKKALEYENISLKTINCHIGSQIFDTEPFVHTAGIMLDFLAQIKAELGYEVPELNLGGGFGIKYVDGQEPMDVGECIESVSLRVKAKCAELGLAQPYIILEPGRKIVGDKGLTLYTVGCVKEIPDGDPKVIVDGGMTDNPRYALYQAEYEAIVANKADKPKDTIVSLCGRTCESGDMLGEKMPLQSAEAGDILAVLATGAYNYSMSSNYNRMMKPAVVFVNRNRATVVVKRETLDDLIRNDVV
ncbi:MAG: diaminopimelate decarboxylase [Oscillospiraceae bacterium]|nr:diaminopimelate decarboxylase [Oscillospiraceae bacterium]